MHGGTKLFKKKSWYKISCSAKCREQKSQLNVSRIYGIVLLKMTGAKIGMI
jgi:hypothetical protein